MRPISFAGQDVTWLDPQATRGVPLSRVDLVNADYVQVASVMRGGSRPSSGPHNPNLRFLLPSFVHTEVQATPVLIDDLWMPDAFTRLEWLWEPGVTSLCQVQMWYAALLRFFLKADGLIDIDRVRALRAIERLQGIPAVTEERVEQRDTISDFIGQHRWNQHGGLPWFNHPNPISWMLKEHGTPQELAALDMSDITNLIQHERTLWLNRSTLR